MFDVRAHFGKWILVGSMAAAPVGAEVIFEENFDDQPDWHSGLTENITSANPAGLPDRVQRQSTHRIPAGWYSVRQDPAWSPSLGDADRHEAIEILSSNREKARGQQGKSFVSWRDSYSAGWNNWASESQMVVIFPDGLSEVYVEFWIRFSEEWTRTFISGKPAATSKIFRVSSWSGEGSEYGAFSDGNLGPIALWDYQVNSYGARNRVSFRGGPHSDNYDFNDEDIPGLPRSFSGIGDLNLNFTDNVQGMATDGGNPKIKDKVNGGYLGETGSVTHDQVFGSNDAWTKLAFYVKLNSAPDKSDGVFKQWLDDQQILSVTNIPWIRYSENKDMNAKWNLVAIGGNDFFQVYDNSLRHEEWYSIDDLVIRSDIPESLIGGSLSDSIPPSPPSRIYVE